MRSTTKAEISEPPAILAWFEAAALALAAGAAATTLAGVIGAAVLEWLAQ